MVGLIRVAASAATAAFAADLVGEGEHLAVEVGDLEAVDVGDHEAADAGARQRHEGRATHAADAADEHPRLAQQLLLVLVDEADVAAGEGVIVETHRMAPPSCLRGRRLPKARLSSSQ